MITDINNSNIKKYHTVDSTNKVAFDLIEKTNLDTEWIIACEQTQGRGRHGRFWESPNGGLYMTRIIHEEIDYKATSNLGFVASLSLYDTAKSFSLNGKFKLK